MTFLIIIGYLCLLVFLGVFAGRLLKRTAGDYFLASRGIGPFMLLMSIFGTTMTAFALIGSTGKTFRQGIGVYGLMASWSGIVHSAVFFLVGAKIWALGKKHGYVTQLSFFRDRYRSEALSLILFPLVVAFVLLYILMGVIGAGRFIEGITPETLGKSDVETRVAVAATPADLEIPAAWQDRVSFDATTNELVVRGSVAPKRRPEFLGFSGATQWQQAIHAAFDKKKFPTGSIPYPVGMAIICIVVLFYVFFGGMRATAWANTLQTMVFMVMGVITFVVIKNAMGGAESATQKVLAAGEECASRAAREGLMGKTEFFTYALIPVSVAMFPHLFQHWLTARRASHFKLTVVAHPICILITWLPCVLLGMWAVAELPLDTNPNIVLPRMVNKFSGDVLAGLISAGVLAAIMSSMDSQFLCLGSLFSNDIIVHHFGRDKVSDRGRVLLGRIFVVIIVAISYVIGLSNTQSIFDLGVWCFTGFASLFPIVFAALYWKRSNKHGCIAATLTVAALWLSLLPKVLRAEPDEAFLTLGMMPVTVIFAASAVVLVVVSLLTPPPDKALVEKFFPRRGEG